MGLLGSVAAFASLCAALALVVSTMLGGAKVELLLPGGSKIPFLAMWPLLATLFFGIVVGLAMRQWSDKNPPRLTVLGLSAIFFLGAAVVVESAAKSDPLVLRTTLLLLVGALVFEATRAEIKRMNVHPRPPSSRRQPLWLVGGGLLALAIPALLGDPTPVRSGLAIGLGAGALASTLAAGKAMRKADGLEISTWSGGLGGGRSSFRLSRAIGMFMLALALAGAAAAIMSQRPAATGAREEAAAVGEGAGKSKKAENAPTAKADKKD
jgi:hypothetical protein